MKLVGRGRYRLRGGGLDCDSSLSLSCRGLEVVPSVVGEGGGSGALFCGVCSGEPRPEVGRSGGEVVFGAGC